MVWFHLCWRSSVPGGQKWREEILGQLLIITTLHCTSAHSGTSVFEACVWQGWGVYVCVCVCICLSICRHFVHVCMCTSCLCVNILLLHITYITVRNYWSGSQGSSVIISTGRGEIDSDSEQIFKKKNKIQKSKDKQIKDTFRKRNLRKNVYSFLSNFAFCSFIPWSYFFSENSLSRRETCRGKKQKSTPCCLLLYCSSCFTLFFLCCVWTILSGKLKLIRVHEKNWIIKIS